MMGKGKAIKGEDQGGRVILQPSTKSHRDDLSPQEPQWKPTLETSNDEEIRPKAILKPRRIER